MTTEVVTTEVVTAEVVTAEVVTAEVVTAEVVTAEVVTAEAKTSKADPRQSGRERLNVWDRILRFAVVVVGGSGLFFVVFGTTTATLFKWLVYGADVNPIAGSEALDYTKFVYGVLGAVMFGWSLTLWCLVVGPLRQRERWAWRAVGISIAGWFAVDTFLSIVSGFGENAILNSAFAVLFGLPLFGMRNEVRVATNDSPRG